MKVLTSTKETQGARESDFCWCNDGELLMFGTQCAEEKEIDGSCGCMRSMVSVKTAFHATTTMIVTELSMTPKELSREIELGLERLDWPSLADRNALKAEVKEQVKNIGIVAESFPAKTILEKRGDTFRVRQVIANGATAHN